MDGFKQLARGSSVRKWQSQDGGGIRGEEGLFFFFSDRNAMHLA